MSAAALAILFRARRDSKHCDFATIPVDCAIVLSPLLIMSYVLLRFLRLLPFCLFFSAASLAGDQSQITRKWDPDVLGNHRFVLRVNQSADAVWAHLDWQRRDQNPQSKDLTVVDAHTGLQVRNVIRIQIDREAGDLLFQPQSGPGEYYVYYLPYTGKPQSSYPKVSYPPPHQSADATWTERIGATDHVAVLSRRASFPAADVVGYEAINDFEGFTEMERIASREQTSDLLAKHPDSSYFVFPEDRSRSIRMISDIPERWAKGGPETPFQGTASPGEYYSFQLGVWAVRASLSEVRVTFSDLSGEKRKNAIPSKRFNCINQGGVDHEGRAFVHQVNVAMGSVLALWCGVDVPEDISPGQYTGDITIAAKDTPSKRVKLTLQVSGDAIRNHGDDEPDRLSRIRWLDSTLAQDDGIVPPYTPVVVQKNSLHILGRTMALGADGLPRSIESYFDETMTEMAKAPRELLAAPISLSILNTAGHPIPWTPSLPRFLEQHEGRAAWEAASNVGPLQVNVHGEMEFDGSVTYSVAVRALRETKLQDIQLKLPFKADVARYVMGLGLQGGTRPASFDWKWNVKHNQDGAWIGDVNAGLQFRLQDDRYSRPLNTNFYLSKPLVMPKSWDNEDRGGCTFRSENPIYLVTCSSGPRMMTAGEVQHYDFHLLLTPFHLINPAKQWRTRFYHAFKPIDEVAAANANTINVHHGTAINPYINYPFLRAPQMKAYVDEAHASGMKVKIYYTIRELSNHAPEIFALRSLGDEIIADGPGKGGPWLQEHLEDHYITGWHVPEFDDSAVVTTGISRWHNFYVEGLRWLVENVGIDGLYLDDVAFDRVTMKRVRKVLARGRPDPMIDLHSANQFDANDGFASSANLYLEHFPYIDRLWFGEYFDYNSSPDYWLVEMSGIPFGLMGEMLQDGGNPWRGMVFGMTDRLPYSGDPRPLWRFWDEFGLQNTRMIGYWVPNTPVRTGRPDVLATVYKCGNRALVALASWAPGPVDVKLAIDWKGLGISPDHARIGAPAIDKFQDAAKFTPSQSIHVLPGKGWLLVLDEGVVHK